MLRTVPIMHVYVNKYVHVSHLLINAWVYEGAPVITPEAKSQTLIEGDAVSFTFKATGTPIPTLNWYFNGARVEMVNSKRHKISETSFNPITKNTTLAIMNVEFSDMGTYTCSADNIVSSAKSYGVLTVNGELLCIHIQCLLIRYVCTIACLYVMLYLCHSLYTCSDQ